MSDRDIIGYLSNEPTITGQMEPEIIISGTMEARFPASVYATSPIKLDRSGANYTFSFDMNAVLEAVNFGGFVLGPASAVDGHFPLLDGPTGKRIKDGKAAPSGEVVGTTDAQTLTNKTLTSPVVTTPTGIVKGDVGLGNVDNTSDADKPVSTAQQTALDLKADKATTLTAGTGLTGGGDLSVNRSVALNSTSVASLGKADTAVQPARTISAGTGLTGGGDLSANRTIALSAGSIASLGKADTAVQPARTISAGTGLTGGGDLSANRTIALSAGSIASLGKADTAVQPGALATVATTGAYNDLSGKPTLGTAASQDTTAFATASQGGKADTAIQSVVAGVNVTVDDTDPRNPIVNASGGGGGSSDPWAAQPIGVPIPLLDNIVGVAQPPTDQSYRYIKLTASDSYNTGVLTSESVTGSAPLVVATAVVSLTGSPINGRTVNLINTERRVLRAGSAGTIENDQMQQITGAVDAGIHASSTVPLLLSHTGAFMTRPPVLHGYGSVVATSTISDGIAFDSANSPNARAGTETRGKNIGVTFFMRVK